MISMLSFIVFVVRVVCVHVFLFHSLPTSVSCMQFLFSSPNVHFEHCFLYEIFVYV